MADRTSLPRSQSSVSGTRLLLGAIAIVASFFLFGRSSQAGFEIPFIDTTNALDGVELRGIHVINRGYAPTTGTRYERYEAYAVGIDGRISDPEKNGVLYAFNGVKWSRVVDFLYKMVGGVPVVQPTFSLNAITTQINPSTGSPSYIIAVGNKGRTTRVTSYNTFEEPESSDFFIDGYTDPLERDLYTVDAGQAYALPIIAGGQKGLVMMAFGGEAFQQPAMVGAEYPAPNGNENITGISFVNLGTAYITTSTFDIDATTGKPKSPFIHECGTGQTSKLYRVTYSGYSLTWTKVGTAATCFYSVSTVVQDDASHAVFVGSERGVYRYTGSDDTVGVLEGPLPGINNEKPTYAVTAITDRGGDGTNLLSNGGFSSYTTSSSKPNGWLVLGQVAKRAGHPEADLSACSNNTSLEVVVKKDSGGQGGDATNPYLFVEPRAIYFYNTALPTCIAGTDEKGFTTGAAQSIPFSTTEGQRYKITGKYKVDFPSAYSPIPTAAQGGVAITCAGNNNVRTPDYVNCSVQNRTNIVVKQPGMPNDGGTGGWVSFETVISREDGIFGNSISKVYTLGQRKMDLEIRCEATYGARVSCDDLRVEEINSPPTSPRKNVTVISGGANLGTNFFAINYNALNPASKFVREPIPAQTLADSTGITTVNAIASLGLQHVFTVGKTTEGSNIVGISLNSRAPSTLSGYIGAGTGSQTSSAHTSIGLISVSCLNDRAADNSSLCQRNQQSYGINLEITTNKGTTRTGTLTGQGWFGKGADDTESLNLGKCVGGIGAIATPPVEYTKVNGSCDLVSRRCRQGTTYTTQSCISDFDCYGRCELDSGFLCLTNNDCTATNATVDGTYSSAFGSLDTYPSARLTCGASVNNVYASPLACAPVGWLSFNASDFSAGLTNPDGTVFGVKYNTLFTGHNTGYDTENAGAHELSGYARFMTPANPSSTNSTQTGWVRFRGDPIASGDIASVEMFTNNTTPKNSSRFIGCRDCAGGGTGSASTTTCAFCQDGKQRSCVPSSIGATAQCHYVCEKDSSYACINNSECAALNKGNCIAPGYCSGNTDASCQNDADCGEGAGTCIIGAVCNIAGGQCAAYGVNLDTETGKFSGYAWSEDYGWLSFRNTVYGGNRIVQTRLGDIYASGAIGNSTTGTTSGTSCNSTFLIQSNRTITNFCSTLGLSELSGGISPTQEHAPFLSFPSQGNRYQNVLGKLDVKGIETVVGGGKNKYGSTVVPLEANATTQDIAADFQTKLTTFGPDKYLNNSVYVIGSAGGSTTYTMNSALTYASAPVDTGPPIVVHNGAGVLIINGNLEINENSVYAPNTTPVKDLRQLASLFVIVKGNLTIKNSVQNIAGSFYVEGTVSTTNSVQNNQYPLTVKGLMMAKAFEFKRKFAGTIEYPLPSELIINDGRLQSNPMPGLVDFSNALPNTATVTP